MSFLDYDRYEDIKECGSMNFHYFQYNGDKFDGFNSTLEVIFYLSTGDEDSVRSLWCDMDRIRLASRGPKFIAQHPFYKPDTMDVVEPLLLDAIIKHPDISESMDGQTALNLLFPHKTTMDKTLMALVGESYIDDLEEELYTSTANKNSSYDEIERYYQWFRNSFDSEGKTFKGERRAFTISVLAHELEAYFRTADFFVKERTV